MVRGVNVRTLQDKKKVLHLFLRILVGGILIGFLLWSVDLEKVKKLIFSSNPIYLWGAVLSFFVAVVVSAFSWKVILKGMGLDISWGKAIFLRLISFFLNTLLPSGIAGDVWRGYVYGNEIKNLGGSFAAVLVEKWVSYVSLALFGGLAIVGGYRQFKEIHLINPLLFFVGGMILSILLSIVLYRYIDKGICFLKRYGVESPYFIGAKYLKEIGTKWEYVVLSLVVTLLSPLLGSLAFYMVSNSVGKPLPVYAFLMLIPIMRVINHVPVSINAIGTQDVVMVLFLSKYGLSVEAGVSMSFLAHFLKMVVSLVGGIAYLVYKR